jgi:hypothetical protein
LQERLQEGGVHCSQWREHAKTGWLVAGSETDIEERFLTYGICKSM